MGKFSQKSKYRGFDSQRSVSVRQRIARKDASLRNDRRETYVWRRGGFLVTLAIGFLIFYIVFDMDDPIEIFDHCVGIIKLYSGSVAWVKGWFEAFYGDLGILGWLIEKIFSVDVDFDLLDFFRFGKVSKWWA